MLVPSLLFLVAAVAYANEDEESASSGEVVMMEIPDYAPEILGMYGKRAVMPFSGGFYGKRARTVPFSGGMYGKRSAGSDDSSDERVESPLSGDANVVVSGWQDKRAVMPFSGGLYGKRAGMPFSGGRFGSQFTCLYGKRVAMPFSGGLYGKRSSERNIRSPMPISGGFFG
ncbi:unnamed protein product [Heligmosomoides polygyrus]|uniref:Allatostatin n=1 Tax=Heligmosomoides polygyrus TaxID=6339 RepID=A0A183FVP6_HELPZ|nr:unnamed protein product [Heligmosomoides polygyrus]